MKLTIDIPPVNNIMYSGRQDCEAVTDLNIKLCVGSTPDDIISAFRTAMYALSYHPNTIKEYLPTREEIDELLTKEEE